MGFLDNIKAVQVPSPKQVMGAYKDVKMSVKRIDVNTINVRFYPKNSPFFYPTKGELYHFGIVTVLKIEVPEKLGWIVEDDSVLFDKTTKEEWIECRPDYPLTLSANKQLVELLKAAIKKFPDIEEWYIPSAISRIPVKNVIINRDLNALSETKELAEKVAQSANIVEWLDKLPATITVTPKFLYDYMDIVVIGSLKDEANNFSWTAFIMGGLMFGLLIMGFMVYIGR